MRRICLLLLVALLSFFVCGIADAQPINESLGQRLNDGSASGARIAAKSDGSLKFAVMSDVHISVGAKSVEWTELCVADINKNPDIQFVIISGDIANFGSDDEIVLSKSIFDKLEKPWFIIPGNHDATWSESGTNTFARVFGYERFEFEAGNIKFLGTPCGPNIRMAPALVPRESMLWLGEQIEAMDDEQPLFFVNHYPLDTSLLKYNEVIDLLKKKNIQLVLSGHWHKNEAMEYEGIPGAIIRSTQKDARREPGYVVVDVDGSLISFREKIVGAASPKSPWYRVRMSKGAAFRSGKEYYRAASSLNSDYPNVKEIWRFENNADIGSALAVYSPDKSKIAVADDYHKGANLIPWLKSETSERDIVIISDEAGRIKALNAANGSHLWEFATDGKIFSTPAVDGRWVVVGSSDGNIYCLDAKNGKLNWKYKCSKSVLGSANIFSGVVYIGASDGKFRAIDLKSGKLRWEYSDIKGAIVARPFVDREQVVIGDWANRLYSFNPRNGKLQWIWHTPKNLHNFSPAQVWPIKSNGKIIIVCPDRFSYQIDAKSGKTIASNYGGREAIGLSLDGYSYYVKSMKDTVKCISTIIPAARVSSSTFGSANVSNTDRDGSILPTARVLWTSMPGYNYEIGPTPITSVAGVGKDGKGLIFIATDKGNIFALNSLDGSLAFAHKISGALVNYIMPIGKNQLLVSTMDGVIALLRY